MIFSFFYPFSRAEYAILIILFACVMGSEILNTAIEETVNILVRNYDLDAKHVKDMAAGGVLVFAAGSVAVGFLLFWDIEIMGKIVRILFGNPFYAAAFVASLVVSYIFVRKGERNKK